MSADYPPDDSHPSIVAATYPTLSLSLSLNPHPTPSPVPRRHCGRISTSRLSDTGRRGAVVAADDAAAAPPPSFSSAARATTAAVGAATAPASPPPPLRRHRPKDRQHYRGIFQECPEWRRHYYTRNHHQAGPASSPPQSKRHEVRASTTTARPKMAKEKQQRKEERQPRAQRAESVSVSKARSSRRSLSTSGRPQRHRNRPAHRQSGIGPGAVVSDTDVTGQADLSAHKALPSLPQLSRLGRHRLKAGRLKKLVGPHYHRNQERGNLQPSPNDGVAVANDMASTATSPGHLGRVDLSRGKWQQTKADQHMAAKVTKANGHHQTTTADGQQEKGKHDDESAMVSHGHGPITTDEISQLEKKHQREKLRGHHQRPQLSASWDDLWKSMDDCSRDWQPPSSGPGQLTQSSSEPQLTARHSGLVGSTWSPHPTVAGKGGKGNAGAPVGAPHPDQVNGDGHVGANTNFSGPLLKQFPMAVPERPPASPAEAGRATRKMAGRSPGQNGPTAHSLQRPHHIAPWRGGPLPSANAPNGLPSADSGDGKAEGPDKHGSCFGPTLSPPRLLGRSNVDRQPPCTEPPGQPLPSIPERSDMTDAATRLWCDGAVPSGRLSAPGANPHGAGSDGAIGPTGDGQARTAEDVAGDGASSKMTEPRPDGLLVLPQRDEPEAAAAAAPTGRRGPRLPKAPDVDRLHRPSGHNTSEDSESRSSHESSSATEMTDSCGEEGGRSWALVKKVLQCRIERTKGLKFRDLAHERAARVAGSGATAVSRRSLGRDSWAPDASSDGSPPTSPSRPVPRPIPTGVVGGGRMGPATAARTDGLSRRQAATCSWDSARADGGPALFGPSRIMVLAETDPETQMFRASATAGSPGARSSPKKKKAGRERLGPTAGSGSSSPTGGIRGGAASASAVAVAESKRSVPSTPPSHPQLELPERCSGKKGPAEQRLLHRLGRESSDIQLAMSVLSRRRETLSTVVDRGAWLEPDQKDGRVGSADAGRAGSWRRSAATGNEGDEAGVNLPALSLARQYCCDSPEGGSRWASSGGEEGRRSDGISSTF